MRKDMDKNRTANPAVLAALEELFKNHEIRSAHYWGYAHLPMLRFLVHRLGTECSVMDYWDRFHTGAAFLADDDVAALIPGRPDWLEGIAFYVEGTPTAELYILDAPLSSDSFAQCFLERSHGLPPNYILLADEARLLAGHPDYDWTRTPEYAVGVRRVRIQDHRGEAGWR